MPDQPRDSADHDAGLRGALRQLIEAGGERENKFGRGWSPTGTVSVETLEGLLAEFPLSPAGGRDTTDHGAPWIYEVVERVRPYYGRMTLDHALADTKTMVEEWSYQDDPHGYCHVRPMLIALVEAVEECDRYKQVAEHLGSEMAEIKASLMEVAVYEGMGGSPTALLVTELVRDHEELEARIDAALSFISGAPSFLPSERTRKDLAEIARLLKGGQRVPDTIEGIES